MSKGNKSVKTNKVSKVNKTSKMTRILALVLAGLLFVGVAAGMIANFFA